MSICELYDAFDPKEACELIFDPDESENTRLCQLVAFNMLLAWALWPEDEGQPAAEQAARVTARSLMLDIQLSIEASYRQARKRPRIPVANYRNQLLSALSLQAAWAQQTYRPEYFLFLDEIFFPIGGWEAIMGTLNRPSYRKQIKRAWCEARVCAFVADHLLRYGATISSDKASQNRAISFIENNGYGASAVMSRAKILNVTSRYKSRLALLYAVWKASPDQYLLSDLFEPGDNERQRRSLHQARDVLRTADLAARKLIELPNVAAMNPNFFRPDVVVASDSGHGLLALEPFSETERKLNQKYRAPVRTPVEA